MLKTKIQLQKSHVEEQELFKAVDFDHIMPLIADCIIYDVQQNEVIISAKEHTKKNIFLILSGSFHVLLELDRSEPIAVLKSGQSIGEISVIDHKPASAFVKAVEDSRVVLLEEEKVWALIKHSHAISNNLIAVLSQRLRQGNVLIKKIEDLLEEYEYNATVDSLTNFYNRRWLDNMLIRVMQRCYKDNKALSAMMMDIDNFKAYNDNNGHLAGDIALSTVSKSIKEYMRPEDMVARYGGEELFALLPGLEIKSAVLVAQRLRKAVKETIIQDQHAQSLPRVTISIGVAEMRDQGDPYKLIEMADNAMYKAKNAGRDKVCY